MRLVNVSRETAEQAKKSPKKLVQVYSFFPCDRGDCGCAKMIADWKKRLSSVNRVEQIKLRENVPFLECPQDKVGMKQWEIVCGKCKQIQGYCWATTPDLLDFCDFHYVSWTKGDYWNGNFGTHISPITQQLCLECVCGNDTRDFRANTRLPQPIAEDRERKNSIGRLYNQKDSKFIVRQAKRKVLR